MSEIQGLQKLDLQQIAQMDDGRIGAAMAQALSRVATDMDDRPGDDRPRKVTLEIACVPVVDETGLCDSVKLQMQVKEAYPTRKSKVYDMGLRKGGMMVYQPMSLDDHHQQPLPMDYDPADKGHDEL